MCEENLMSTCKQRFKGVECFLRRIAFNLGNSPSQTEVKIISCIPIDVTDLQQKIIYLEKELEEAKASCNQRKTEIVSEPVVQTVICQRSSAFPGRAERPASGPDQCDRPFLTRIDSEKSNTAPASSKNMDDSCWPFEQYADYNEAYSKRRFLFRKTKKKMPPKKEKFKTQIVYFAQADNNPFNQTDDTRATSPQSSFNKRQYVADPVPSTSPEQDISRMYISEMIQKQYKTKPIAEDLSIASQFSSPICRDIDHSCTHWNGTTRYASDVCSCIHGLFHDVDDQEVPTSTCSYNNNNNSDFYDSSLYDMVPVKENPRKTPNYSSENIKQNPKCNINNAIRMQDRSRQKYRYHPFIVNYSTITGSPTYFPRKPMNTVNKKEKYRRISPKREKPVYDDTTSCSIDCGNIYMKMMNARPKAHTAVGPIKAITLKNAECLTISKNDTECQTTTTQSVQIESDVYDDKKTEDTLNQIKTILQTVLTEVKSNALAKKTTEEKLKKDAVVQKGLSQGNVPACPSLLHSFSYSPYNMNPYAPSCSRQLNTAPCCFPNVPYQNGKCMQNFPVFIQAPGRNFCTSCYRNSPHTIPTPNKEAATTATNTESKERSKETQKLIKEIYKSMAVNLSAPVKETTEYEDTKSTRRSAVNKPVIKANENKKAKSVAASVNKGNVTDFKSKVTSNTLSLRSQIVSTTDTEGYLRNSRIQSYLKNLDHQKHEQKVIQQKVFEEVETTESEEEYDEAISKEESEDETVPAAQPVKKSDKKGLFSKMFNIFGKNKKKSEQTRAATAPEEESDDESDDYQTIYSQRMPTGIRYVTLPARYRTRSKTSVLRNKDRHQTKHRRIPYMEQENRRRWNEKLTFHETKPKYSSETQGSRYKKPYIYQKFEARPVLVGQSLAIGSKRSPVICNSIKKFVPRTQKRGNGPKVNVASKGLSWLKRHKLGMTCNGEQWKKIILES